MLNNKFNYEDLSTETINGKRHYVVGETKLPSVTTVLGETKSADTVQALSNWRARVGAVEADRILQNSLTIGSALHKNIEDYCLHGKTKFEGPLQIKMMTEVMIRKGLCNIDEVWGAEVALYYPDLYAGRSDMIGVYKGKTSIIDFKNSIKTKKVEYINDYLVQCSAYKLAHDYVYGTDIEQYVILLVTQDFEFQEFVIDHDSQQPYLDEWTDRVGRYHQVNK